MDKKKKEFAPYDFPLSKKFSSEHFFGNFNPSWDIVLFLLKLGTL